MSPLDLGRVHTETQALKIKLRDSVQKVVAEQMKHAANAGDFDEEAVNLNLQRLHVNARDPEERQEEVKFLLQEALEDIMKYNKKVKITPSIYKFRALVTKHLMTATVQDIHNLCVHKVDVTLVAKVQPFVVTLGKMFPKQYNEGSMALKFETIGKNLFINDFLYGILGELTSQIDQEIMRDHFALQHSEDVEDDEPAQVACPHNKLYE